MGRPLQVVDTRRRAPIVALDVSHTAPVTLAQVRQAMGMAEAEIESDEYLVTLIGVAEGKVEKELRRAIRSQKRRWYGKFNTPPYSFMLPEPPRGRSNSDDSPVSNAVVIEYADGGSDTWSAVGQDVYAIRGMSVDLLLNSQWPIPNFSTVFQTWRLTLECGFASIPPDVQHRIIEWTMHLYAPKDYGMPVAPWHSRWVVNPPLNDDDSWDF